MNIPAYTLAIAGAVWLTSCHTSVQTPSGLSDPRATAETRAVFNELKSLAGSATLFGHQDATVYGIGWKYQAHQSDVKKVTGQHPAVYGWEIGHIEMGDSLSLDSVHFSKIRSEAIAAYQRGGIQTFSWHLRNPLTGGDSWDVSSHKVVASILPGGEKHELYIQWLNRLAEYFQSFRTSGGIPVPILFRPFHEHSGSWFWWGEKHCTKEEYLSLYRFTVNYLRNHKQLHNLLFVFSPDRVNEVQEYLSRYPGDEYVDILGLDLYDRDAQYGATATKLLTMVREEAVRRQKPWVFSETGSEGIKNPLWFTKVLYPILAQTRPAYVLVWRNAYERPEHHFAPYPEHPSAPDFIQFTQKPDILLEGDSIDAAL